MLYYIKTEKSWPELGESPNRTNQYQGWCRLVACLEFKQGGRMMEFEDIPFEQAIMELTLCYIHQNDDRVYKQLEGGNQNDRNKTRRD